MPDQKPSLGRIVHYTLTEQDAKRFNTQQASALLAQTSNLLGMMLSPYTDEDDFVTETAEEGNIHPAMMVWVNTDGTVNLQVFLDGSDTLYAPGRSEGDGKPGTWHWPERV